VPVEGWGTQTRIKEILDITSSTTTQGMGTWADGTWNQRICGSEEERGPPSGDGNDRKSHVAQAGLS